MKRRNDEAAQRFAERRRREDDAPRLTTEITDLESLVLEVEERRSGISYPGATHVRRIVVETAPALFVLPCHDSHCKEGGHDVTYAVMRALQARQVRFEGDDACGGLIGASACQCVLHYVGTATYRQPTRSRQPL
jgi:hypothetical protein